MPAASTEAASGFWPAAAQVLTWVLVIGGWIYTNNTHNARESRKELRSLLDKLQRDLDALVDLAQAYYQMDVDAGRKKEAEMLVRLNRLLNALDHLSFRYLAMKSDNLDRTLKGLMDQLTGGTFQTADRIKAEANDPRMLSIAHAGLEVHGELESLFTRFVK